ncbi:LysE family translocator [Streptomyces sp. NPDC046821]|uniref:LysE family translocator n=1 Tax=Streptomyces sp. NPDC046821 TaxID=3154702 RepID=UPI0033D49560
MLVRVIISSAAASGIALVELGMALTPGPNMMYLVSRSISQGRTAGLVSLVGTAVGFVVYMVLANVGLAVVFVAVPWLYIGFKAAGAAYLAYLAWQALRPGGHGLFEQRTLPRDSHWKLLRTGLITNLLNPKVAILYLALIPQFIDPARGRTTAQGFALGAVQIAVGVTVNALIVLAAGSVAGLLKRRPSWVKWQRVITGTLLGAISIVLAREVPARASA